MEYIILDTEWNNSYCRRTGGFVNEIIEIGAVKLDSGLNEIDRFQCIIKSQLTKRLSTRFKTLTHITNEEMCHGVSLEEAVDRYVEWMGEDCLTLTWSNSDIYTLLTNFKLFKNTISIPLIKKYADLQAFVQNHLRKNGFQISSQISLSNAAKLLNISTEDVELHRAVDDSALAAEILRKTFNKKQLMSYVIDTENSDYFARLMFKPYYISNINNPMINKNNLRFRCSTCNRFGRQVTSWKFKNRSFKAKFYCKRCDCSFYGNLAFKRLFDKVVMVKHFNTPILPQGDISNTSVTAEPVILQNNVK